MDRGQAGTLTEAEAAYRAWLNGQGVVQAQASIRRMAGVPIERDTIRQYFAKFSNEI